MVFLAHGGCLKIAAAACRVKMLPDRSQSVDHFLPQSVIRAQ